MSAKLKAFDKLADDVNKKSELSNRMVEERREILQDPGTMALVEICRVADFLSVGPDGVSPVNTQSSFPISDSIPVAVFKTGGQMLASRKLSLGIEEVKPAIGKEGKLAIPRDQEEHGWILLQEDPEGTAKPAFKIYHPSWEGASHEISPEDMGSVYPAAIRISMENLTTALAGNKNLMENPERLNRMREIIEKHGLTKKAE